MTGARERPGAIAALAAGGLILAFLVAFAAHLWVVNKSLASRRAALLEDMAAIVALDLASLDVDLKNVVGLNDYLTDWIALAPGLNGLAVVGSDGVPIASATAVGRTIAASDWDLGSRPAGGRSAAIPGRGDGYAVVAMGRTNAPLLAAGQVAAPTLMALAVALLTIFLAGAAWPVGDVAAERRLIARATALGRRRMGLVVGAHVPEPVEPVEPANRLAGAIVGGANRAAARHKALTARTAIDADGDVAMRAAVKVRAILALLDKALGLSRSGGSYAPRPQDRRSAYRIAIVAGAPWAGFYAAAAALWLSGDPVIPVSLAIALPVAGAALCFGLLRSRALPGRWGEEMSRERRMTIAALAALGVAAIAAGRTSAAAGLAVAGAFALLSAWRLFLKIGRRERSRQRDFWIGGAALATIGAGLGAVSTHFGGDLAGILAATLLALAGMLPCRSGRDRSKPAPAAGGGAPRMSLAWDAQQPKAPSLNAAFPLFQRHMYALASATTAALVMAFPWMAMSAAIAISAQAPVPVAVAAPFWVAVSALLTIMLTRRFDGFPAFPTWLLATCAIGLMVAAALAAPILPPAAATLATAIAAGPAFAILPRNCVALYDSPLAQVRKPSLLSAAAAVGVFSGCSLGVASAFWGTDAAWAIMAAIGGFVAIGAGWRTFLHRPRAGRTS